MNENTIDLSQLREQLAGKPVAVYGLGLSGMATVEALCAYDIACAVWDDNEELREKAKGLGASITPLHENALDAYAFLVLSPGVPLTHPQPHHVVEKAQEAGIEIICDVELFFRALKMNTDAEYRITSVTGTNGKSTTVALIGHILAHAGMRVAVGGNIGTPVFKLPLPTSGGHIVLEMSSFQLDLCHQFKPDIGVLVNMASDHLDRHGDMDGYAKAKTRQFQNGTGTAIIGIDDKYSQAIAQQLDDETSKVERIIPVSIKDEVPQGIYAKEGVLIDGAFHDEPLAVKKFSELSQLPGEHNRQNICMAYAASRTMGLNSDQITAAMADFKGLPHRIFLVDVINGISYVNDSKATNIDSAKRALACYKKIYWIVGGRPKSDGLEGGEEYCDRIRHAFLIGESSDEFAKWFEKRGIEYTMCGTLDKAVSDANEFAQNERGEPGGAGVVLLSPACASFDQYRSFERRGDHFVELIQELRAKRDAEVAVNEANKAGKAG